MIPQQKELLHNYDSEIETEAQTSWIKVLKKGREVLKFRNVYSSGVTKIRIAIIIRGILELAL